MILSNNDPFSPKDWQEFLNQWDFLQTHGLIPEDVRESLRIKMLTITEAMIKPQKEALERFEKLPRCSECKSPLQLLPVNDSPSTQTGDDSKSMWLCRLCHYEEFSPRTIEEELKWQAQD